MMTAKKAERCRERLSHDRSTNRSRNEKAERSARNCPTLLENPSVPVERPPLKRGHPLVLSLSAERSVTSLGKEGGTIDALLRLARQVDALRPCHRDPEAFQALKSQVLPQLLENRSAKEGLRLWVPGCATGEEPYSLAICMFEFLEPVKSHLPIQVFASDINPAAIERARTGFYPKNIAADLTPERLERFFSSTDHGYRINKEIRELCIFGRHRAAAARREQTHDE